MAAPVRRSHVALAHAVIHGTLRMTYVMKHETGDRPHRAAGHPGPAEMPPCECAAPFLRPTSVVRAASVVRLISAVRSISDDRVIELWSIYQCPNSADLHTMLIVQSLNC